MDDLIAELERLHGHALLHVSQMQAAPSYWPHTPDGSRAVGLVVNNFDRLVATFKAAEAMRTALDDCLREHGGFTIRGRCERRSKAALAAYDAAKEG